MKPLAGKVAIVTGASAPHGIGRAIALRLAQDGAFVVVTDIKGKMNINGVEQDKMNLLANTVSEIEFDGGKAVAIDVDVTREEDIVHCVEMTKELFGRLDILVNNAGSLSGSDNFLETTPDQWELSFQVNLLGPMMFSKAVIIEMITS